MVPNVHYERERARVPAHKEQENIAGTLTFSFLLMNAGTLSFIPEGVY